MYPYVEQQVFSFVWTPLSWSNPAPKKSNLCTPKKVVPVDASRVPLKKDHGFWVLGAPDPLRLPHSESKQGGHPTDPEFVGSISPPKSSALKVRTSEPGWLLLVSPRIVIYSPMDILEKGVKSLQNPENSLRDTPSYTEHQGFGPIFVTPHGYPTVLVKSVIRGRKPKEYG